MHMRQDRAVDGFRLAYERTGPGPGAPTVLLLHGWPGDRTDYREVVPLVSGTADVVYYGTTSATNGSGAVWNVYLAQTTDSGASFTQSLVSNKSNHTGVICTQGTGCAAGTRNLLDLFQVGIDPLNDLAAIVYVDDTLTTDPAGNPLPQTVLAQQINHTLFPIPHHGSVCADCHQVSTDYTQFTCINCHTVTTAHRPGMLHPNVCSPSPSCWYQATTCYNCHK